MAYNAVFFCRLVKDLVSLCRLVRDIMFGKGDILCCLVRDILFVQVS